MAAPTVEATAVPSTSTSTSAYPEWEAVPPASPRSTNGRSYVPSLLVRLFSHFPLYTFPAHKSAEAEPSSAASTSKPTLYVATGRQYGDARSWASSDVRSLRWQTELLFRGAAEDVDCEQMSEHGAWGPIYQELPFLNTNRRKLSTLDEDSFRTWLDTRHPYSWDRRELQTTAASTPSSEPYPSRQSQEEAKTWTALLERSVMAAVLLAQMSSEAEAQERQRRRRRSRSPSAPRPLFSRWLRTYLNSQQGNKEAQRVASLSSSADPQWTSVIPTAGLSLSWIGIGASVGVSAGEAQEDPGSAYVSWPTQLDADLVLEEGTQGLAAVESSWNPDQAWFLGAA